LEGTIRAGGTWGLYIGPHAIPQYVGALQIAMTVIKCCFTYYFQFPRRQAHFGPDLTIVDTGSREPVGKLRVR